MLAPDEERARRAEMVHAWQRHYNMEPRADSRLTELYAQGEAGAMSAHEVARELVATDYVYRATLYGEVIEEFMRRVAHRLRAAHPGLSWAATWTIVRAYAPVALRLMCVRSAGVAIPARMPDAA